MKRSFREEGAACVSRFTGATSENESKRTADGNRSWENWANRKTRGRFSRRYLEKFNFLNTSAVTQKQLESSDILGEVILSGVPATRGADRSVGVQASNFLPLPRIYTVAPHLYVVALHLLVHIRVLSRARCRRL